MSPSRRFCTVVVVLSAGAFAAWMYLGAKPNPLHHDALAVVEHTASSAKYSALTRRGEHIPSSPGETLTPAPGQNQEPADDLDAETIVAELFRDPPSRQWLESRGYTMEEQSDYESYPRTQLEALATMGDPKAQQRWATILLAENSPQAFHWFREALINGYTSSISGIVAATTAMKDPNDTPFSVHMAIWSEVGKLSGDPLIAEAADITALDRPLTPAQQADVRARADALFKELEQARAERGLPPLANAPAPDHVIQTMNTVFVIERRKRERALAARSMRP